MTQRFARRLLVPVCSLLVCSAAQAEKRFTYVDLVRQMKDLERPAVLPEPGERTILCSSYDRRSRYDAQTGGYINWFANNDFHGQGFVRQESNTFVLAELEGPGCIQRMFSADELMEARVQIYLDGGKDPVVEMPMRQLLSGKERPFDRGGSRGSWVWPASVAG